MYDTLMQIAKEWEPGMLVELKCLFGNLCLDEAMPDGTERDCSAALETAAVLRTAMELAPAPAPVMANDRVPDTKPELKPEPAPAMGFRR